MSLRSSQECVCRVLDEARTSPRQARPMVILTGSDTLKEVRDMVSASMPEGTSCYGNVWQAPNGEVVSVKSYDEKVPPYEAGFDFEVCNGGREYTPDERRDLQRWRDASG